MRKTRIVVDTNVVFSATFGGKPERTVERSPDPSDDKFLEAAEESGADYLVTGDSHLLKLEEHKNTKIVKPEEFMGEI
ncbi:MAG: hypothetical protein MUP58_01675 [Candidatus Nanohaloarchaeota archaeon QJJ-9]|nr:hypothetical protein [Candidatus Nanohaloarchaeota archaeon QJJ-9]